MRTTPFDEIDRLFDRMNRRFADFDTSFDDSRFEGMARSPSMTRFTGMHQFGGMRIDVADEGEEILVVADLPGFEKEDIDLSVTEDAITVSATREQDASEEDESYVRRERSSESVRRTVSLPAMVDAESATATYKNGVLSVTLPKVDVEDDAHRIDID